MSADKNITDAGFDFRTSEYKKRRLEREEEIRKEEELAAGAKVAEQGLREEAVESQNIAQEGQQKEIVAKQMLQEEEEKASQMGAEAPAQSRKKEKKDETQIRKKFRAEVKAAVMKKMKEKAAKEAKEKVGKAVGRALVRQIGAGIAALAGSFGWIGLLIGLAIIVVIGVIAFFYSQCESNALAQEFCSVFVGTGSSGFGGVGQGTGQTPAPTDWQNNFSVQHPTDQISDADPALITLINCVNQAYPAASAWRVTSISDDNITPGLSECQGDQYNTSLCQHSKNSCHYGGSKNCPYSVAFDAQTLNSDTNDSQFVEAVKSCNGGNSPGVESTHWHINVASRAEACGCGRR